MKGKARNQNHSLRAAKAAKQDEFYTQLAEYAHLVKIKGPHFLPSAAEDDLKFLGKYREINPEKSTILRL